MDVRDAAFAIASDHPGGIAALAARMGLDTDELRAKLDPRNKAAILGLHESVALQFLTGDHRILQAMAEELGYECVPLDGAPQPRLTTKTPLGKGRD